MNQLDVSTKPVPAAPMPKPDKRPPRLPHPQYAVKLTVDFDGTVIDFPLPAGLTTKELGELLAELNLRRGSVQ